MDATLQIERREPPRVFEPNPLALVSADDPFPTYAALRDDAPVVWLAALGVWGVFRDSVIREVLNDKDRFIAAGGTGLPNYLREKQWKELGALEADGPDHMRLRNILIRILAPAALMKLQAGFATEAKRLSEELVERGSFDGATDFAKAFPLKVFLDAVGVAEEDRERILLFNDVIRKFRAASRDEMTAEDHDAVQDFLNWERGFCSRENVAPDSFGAQIYEAVDAGKASETEGNRLVRTFISAGTGTTIAALSQTLYHLARNPEQWALLRTDPAKKARAAFDEALRFDSPVQFVGRTARDGFEWHGAQIARHDKVLAFVASANRDPERWPDADRYSIDRNLNGHLGLGLGIHGCVGQMLARMQAEALVAALANAADSIEVNGPAVRNPNGLRGFQSLPIRVVRGTAA